MKNLGISGLLLAMVLVSAPAFSAQNVANTSQKGSLLIFPLIDVRVETSSTGVLEQKTTSIEISNDFNRGVILECFYVNQRKDRVDFTVPLSSKGTVTWDALTGVGEGLFAPPFPSGGTFGAPALNPHVGELVCFAVNGNQPSAQVAWNHLHGHATVIAFNDANAAQHKQALEYPAWSFTARGIVTEGTPVGIPGDLQLTGGGLGTYDACPLYLVESYSPGGTLNGIPNTLASLTTIDNDLSLSSCKQDLRENFRLHLIKLKLTTWNAGEQQFSGAYQCADSVQTFGLDDPEDALPLPHAALSNFSFGVLRTHNARFEVDGISDPVVCQGSESAGLVGVLTSSIGINNRTSEDAEIGTTLHGAGAADGVQSIGGQVIQTGFVLWDVMNSGVPSTAGQR